MRFLIINASFFITSDVMRPRFINHALHSMLQFKRFVCIIVFPYNFLFAVISLLYALIKHPFNMSFPECVVRRKINNCAQKYIETDALFAAIFDHLFFWNLLKSKYGVEMIDPIEYGVIQWNASWVHYRCSSFYHWTFTDQLGRLCSIQTLNVRLATGRFSRSWIFSGLPLPRVVRWCFGIYRFFVDNTAFKPNARPNICFLHQSSISAFP